MRRDEAEAAMWFITTVKPFDWEQESLEEFEARYKRDFDAVIEQVRANRWYRRLWRKVVGR